MRHFGLVRHNRAVARLDVGVGDLAQRRLGGGQVCIQTVFEFGRRFVALARVAERGGASQEQAIDFSHGARRRRGGQVIRCGLHPALCVAAARERPEQEAP